MSNPKFYALMVDIERELAEYEQAIADAKAFMAEWKARQASSASAPEEAAPV